MNGTKTCRMCKTEKPLTKEYFYKSKGSKDGFRNECKPCYMERYKEARKISHAKYYEENLEKIKEYRDKNKEKIKLYHKSYQKEYLKKNTEKISEKKRKYRLTNIELIKKREKNYRKSPESLERKSVREQKRRAFKKQLPNTLTFEQWEETKGHFDNKCAYCGKSEKLQQEHFIPLSKGGEFTHNNIIPACAKCNISKKDKDFFEWFPRFEYYNKHREKYILDYLGYKNNIQQLSIL